MEKTAKIIVRYKWIIIVLTVLLTGFFSYKMKDVKIDSNIVNSLPKDDSVVNAFKEVGKRFGGNQMGMIILEANNVFRKKVLNDISEITDTLKNISGVSSVTSLTNIMSVTVSGDDFIVGNLINDSNFPKNKDEADSLRNIVTANEMYRGTIVSADGTASLILFSFQDGARDQVIAEQIKKTINNLNLPEECYYGGSSFLTSYVSETVSSDLILLIPIAFIVMAVVLLLSFRSLRGIFLPLLSAGLAIDWAIGTFVLLGLKLSMVSNNVPIIILAVGTAYTIHVINRINHCKEKDLNKAVLISLKYLIIPVSLTALTTIVGFMSFVFGAYLSLIRDFGILASLGTLYSALLSLLFIPALILVLPDKRKTGNNGSTKSKKFALLDKALIVFRDIAFNYPNRVIIWWSVLIAISIVGIFMIKRSTNVSDYFKKDHPATIANNILNKKFGGSKVIFVVFDGDVQSPAFLKEMLKTEEYLKKSQYIYSTQSIADIISRMSQAITGIDSIPNDEDAIGQYWFLLDQQESLNQLVSPDLDEAIIIAKFNAVGLNAINNFDNYIKPFIKSNSTKDIRIRITGMPYVNKQLDRNLIHSQFLSLSLAIIMVIIVVSLIFFDFEKGIIASIPIICTIIILYGIMGLTGIPLNIVTVLVASIAMGIGIDYSIHFISHYNISVIYFEDKKKAIEESILVSGKAILINFISVTAGFLVLIFSDLVPMIYFGILIAISMLGSSMGALTLLPVILLKNKYKNS